ncbi:hypothetical protein KRB99_000014 [Salmonella enterica]|nr:hypothetical protein [Salmonella enterica]
MQYKNVMKFFLTMTDEQKAKVDEIFNDVYEYQKPESRFHALAHCAAYVISGTDGQPGLDPIPGLPDVVEGAE